MPFFTLDDLLLMDHKLRIIVWNVRGLNSCARRIAIRSLVDIAGASIVCFQETKMELICTRTILETLGPDFDEYVYLPAIGTCGGILLAWKGHEFSLSDQEFSTNTISAKVSAPNGALPGGSL